MNNLTNDSLYVAVAVTWVCSCLTAFIFSLNWPHECEIVNCQHKKLEQRRHK